MAATEGDVAAAEGEVIINPAPVEAEGSVELKTGEEVVLEMEVSEEVSVEIEQPVRSDSSKLECCTSVAREYTNYLITCICSYL